MFIADLHPGTDNYMLSKNGYANPALTPSGGITEIWYYKDGSTGWTN